MVSEWNLRLAGRTIPIRVRRKRMTPVRRWTLVITLLLPLIIIALKHSPLPFADALREGLSLGGSSHEVKGRVANVLLVPLGAAVVVFFRIALGIRVLGPFRSVLLAIAFQVTGIPLGLFFLSLVISVIVAMRRTIKRLRLPYFSRLSFTLSTVATIITVTLVAARAFDFAALGRAAYFPIVVLCLTADGFAKTLRREGTRSALWRGGMTALVAVLISGIARNAAVEQFLARYPELLLAEIGMIVVISYFLGFRLFAFLNPPIPKKKKRKKAAKAKKAKAAALAGSPSPILVSIPGGLASPSPDDLPVVSNPAGTLDRPDLTPLALRTPVTVGGAVRAHEKE
ncbi:MAG: 7TM domain-containing protein [Candidatus Eisenbacteria bacterium]